MAEILTITDKEVKIGAENGKVLTVPASSLNFPNPREGDHVKVFKDGDGYIVKKVGLNLNPNGMYQEKEDGGKSVNKHLFVWVGSFLFGYLGVDRFMRGQIGLGICKILFNWLTLGIWELVDWIIAMSKAYGAFSDTENVTFDASGHYTR
jgi:TM2 domain-containing membrane protein YozV